MTNFKNQTKMKPSAQEQVNIARSNLLLMIGFTFVNTVLLLLNADLMLLFSATIPYFIVAVGVAYETQMALIVCGGIALAIIGLYLLCWYFSKNHYGWMVFATVLFVIDTLFMLWIYYISGDFSGVVDIAIHAWVLYYLITGVIYGRKLKNSPEEIELVFEETIEPVEETEN